MKTLQSRQGMSLVGAMVSLVIVAISSVALMKHIRSLNQANRNVGLKSAQNALLSQVASYAADPRRYLELLARSPAGAQFVLQCLNVANPVCPNQAANVAEFPELAASVGGQHVIELPLLSSSGQMLGGTAANPILWSSAGTRCQGDPTCPMETRGFAVMQSVNNPDALRFVLLSRVNPASPGGAQTMLATRMAEIDVGIPQWPVSCARMQNLP